MNRRAPLVDALARLTDDDIQLLYDSGCQKLAIGMEAGSQNILDSLNKRYRLKFLLRSTGVSANTILCWPTTLSLDFPMKLLKI